MAIATITEDWQQMRTAKFAQVVQAGFSKASVLPNHDVFNAAIRASAGRPGHAGPRPLDLVAVNDDWSVYVIGAASLAVASHDGETVEIDDLQDEDDAKSRNMPAWAVEYIRERDDY